MKLSRKAIVTTSVAATILATVLTACNSNPPSASACSMPKGPDLDQALAAARFDLETGCEGQFDVYFQRLLTIAAIELGQIINGGGAAVVAGDSDRRLRRRQHH